MISNNDQRILVDNAGTISDFTKEVNAYNGGVASISLSPGDFIYFGSFLPFNQKYFDLSTVSNAVTTLKVEIYDGAAWKQCFDLLDYTEIADIPLGRSGTIQFNKVDDDGWGLITRSTEIAELASFHEIYGKYWARFSLADAAAVDIKYIGSLFGGHSDLVDEYPMLSNLMLIDSWEAGKTDWLEQMIKASEYVIADLKKRGIIFERSQVIEQSVLLEPTIHKAAQIIFNGLGAKNYAEEISEAKELYKSSMNMDKFEQDTNASGQKERFEQAVSTSRARR